MILILIPTISGSVRLRQKLIPNLKSVDT